MKGERTGWDQLDEVILDIKTSPAYVRRRNWRESLRAQWLLFRTPRAGEEREETAK